jgi:hypothetical protein
LKKIREVLKMKKGEWLKPSDRKGKKKQVVETTCGSHEKTSEDSYNKTGELPPKNRKPPGEYL